MRTRGTTTTLLALVALCVLSLPLWAADKSHQITEYLDSLKDLKTVTPNSAVISHSVAQPSGFGDARVTCHTDGVRDQGTIEQLAAYGSRLDVLWPGSIIQGSSLFSNQLAPIALAHGPQGINVTAFVPGAEPGSTVPQTVRAKVSEPTLGTVTDAVHRLVFANPGTHQPASMSFKVDEIYSEQQAATAISASYSGIGADISGYLRTESFATRSHVVATFVQKYYTVAVEPPQHPSDFFRSKVKLEHVKSQTSQAHGPNPAVYINTIDYGRIAYIFISSNEDVHTLRAAVDASFNGLMAGGSLSGSERQKEIVRGSQVRVFVLGGDAGAGTDLVNRKLEALPTWIQTGATFSRQSPGAVISFSTRYLKSGYGVAGVAFVTDYARPGCVPTPERIIGVQRSYAINDDKDRGNAHRFLVLQGSAMLAAEEWGGDDIVWRTSPPNYNGPMLPVNIPFQQCSSLRFRTEQSGSHGETTGRTWIYGVTDAGRRLLLVEGEPFSIDDNGARDYAANCRVQ